MAAFYGARPADGIERLRGRSLEPRKNLHLFRQPSAVDLDGRNRGRQLGELGRA